jgi:hypothetical protein
VGLKSLPPHSSCSFQLAAIAVFDYSIALQQAARLPSTATMVKTFFHYGCRWVLQLIRIFRIVSSKNMLFKWELLLVQSFAAATHD